jgi:methyltransferase (TIGR00027 family)
MQEYIHTPEQLRIEKKASETAMFAAIHRHLAYKEEDPSFQGPDYMANLFLPGKAKFFLSFKFMRNLIRKKLRKGVPGTFEYMVARTKHFDNLFKQALLENIPQVVLLGAGYDTRSIRYKDQIKDTMIFELDTPIIQLQKKNLLKKSRITTPDQLTYVPIDFNKESINDLLPVAGYNTALQTFFLWEGVTYYLTEEDIRDTLYFINIFSGPATTVAFDYFLKGGISGDAELYGAKEINKEVRKSGEPFRFGLDEGQIKSFLSESGFDIISHYSPEEFEKAYLYDDQGKYYGRMYGFAYNVIARVKA